MKALEDGRSQGLQLFRRTLPPLGIGGDFIRNLLPFVEPPRPARSTAEM
jgi:hypothetical protein